MIPEMPKTTDRRLLDDGFPAGYLESNKDWSRQNDEAIGWLADNHKAIRAALPSPGLETPRMLVLSTSHIGPKTVSMLENGTGHLPCGIARRDHGWVIPIHEHWDGEDEDEKVPADLAQIRDFAVSIGCTWICLDSDGDILTDLPTYNW